jgi:alpha(1,3/1,4) fucosyltransferase
MQSPLTLRIWFSNFWSNFCGAQLLKRSFLNVLREDNFEFVLDRENPQIIFFSSFGDSINYTGSAIKIGYVTESLDRFQKFSRLISDGFFDLVIGCVEQTSLVNFCKHPLYIHSSNHLDPSRKNIKHVNLSVKTRNLEKLRFCTLIASHDHFGNRLPILRLLSTLGFIECPGQLAQNVQSLESRKLTKQRYLENFLFNLCPENSKGQRGYTSEKIKDAITAGCIPIYYGNANDPLDVRIFNQKRIIRYDPSSKPSAVACFSKVKRLVEHPSELLEFYQQPPYLDTAEDALEKMRQDLQRKFRTLLSQKPLI